MQSREVIMPLPKYTANAAPALLIALGMLIVAQSFSEAAAQATPATQNKRPLSDIQIRIGGDRQKNNDANGEPVAADPDWGAVRRAQRRGETFSFAQMQALSRQNRQRTNAFVRKISIWATQTRSADVPVLLPLSEATAVQSSFASGANYYDYQSRRANGESLVVSGVCGGTLLPDDHPIAQRMRKQRKKAQRLTRLDARYKISQDERGHVLNFAKFNCSYELILNCPEGCNHNAKLIGHAESLGVLNAR